MTPTAAARASQSSAPTLRDRLKDPSLLREQCYIDGAWVGTPSTPVTNPVNSVELAKVPKMSTAEATQAVEAAERAFPAWAKLTAKQRSNILRKWFDLIVANREDLALILTSEQGKPLVGGARRSRYRRRLCRVLRGRSPARLWRNHSNAEGRMRGCSRSSSRSAFAARSRRGISPAR